MYCVFVCQWPVYVLALLCTCALFETNIGYVHVHFWLSAASFGRWKLGTFRIPEVCVPSVYLAAIVVRFIISPLPKYQSTFSRSIDVSERCATGPVAVVVQYLLSTSQLTARRTDYSHYRCVKILFVVGIVIYSA